MTVCYPNLGRSRRIRSWRPACLKKVKELRKLNIVVGLGVVVHANPAAGRQASEISLLYLTCSNLPLLYLRALSRGGRAFGAQ